MRPADRRWWTGRFGVAVVALGVLANPVLGMAQQDTTMAAGESLRSRTRPALWVALAMMALFAAVSWFVPFMFLKIELTFFQMSHTQH